MSETGWRAERRIPGFERCFGWYVNRLLRSSFSRVWIREDSAALPAGGYIGVGNHSTWWDGFVPFALHRAANPQRPFAIMMADDQLRRFPFFRFGGAFSVDASGARRAKPSFDRAALLASGGCGVWIFPQGALIPPTAPLRFTSGFAHAARVAGVPIVPVAMRFVFRSAQRPEIVVQIGAPASPKLRHCSLVIRDTVAGMLEQLDADVAAARIESRYRPALAGRPGIDDRIGAFIGRFAKS